ncbi:MAG: LamG domain-containing protein [Deltaproteobacteria bacterium]|nr:LamG domain-containing protein [Deltaproteobacteria bacterium]MBW2551090.1 LamG domain-containing protein [Deltaproteobacteria bacterium]
MRLLIGLVCSVAFSIVPLVGCSDATAGGGSGGAGTGGAAGVGGTGGAAGVGGTGGAAGVGGTGGISAVGLVAYYPFNGNANDESGNGNDGTALGGAVLTSDRFGNADAAYSFDGTSGYIQIPDSPDFDFNQPITLTAWIYLNDNTKGGIVGQWGPGGESGDAFTLGVKDGKARLTLLVPGLYELSSVSDLGLEEWLFVSVVYDGTSLKLFVNGTPDASDNIMVDQVDSTQPVTIGFERILSGEPAYLNGTIDDVRIYRIPLSDGEILQLYNVSD